MELDKIFNEDCLDGMKRIPAESVDCIICDLPYEVLNKGNKHAQWDKLIPFDKLWEQYERVIKPNGAIILFAQGLFTAKLMTSNEKLWRYNLIWKKGTRSTGFLNANRMPLRNHEDLCVFYKQQPTYNPQMWKGRPNHTRSATRRPVKNNRCYGVMDQTPTIITEWKYPFSIIDIEKEHKKQYHSTQKPVALIEYLIKTYTNEGETVLDNCMGSGTTAIAAINTNRRFIGFELDTDFFEIANKRIEDFRQRMV